jgi:hypothetical protein
MVALTFLRAFLLCRVTEQVEIRQLRWDVGSYLYEAVKAEAIKLGYLQNENNGVVS